LTRFAFHDTRGATPVEWSDHFSEKRAKTSAASPVADSLSVIPEKGSQDAFE